MKDLIKIIKRQGFVKLSLLASLGAVIISIPIIIHATKQPAEKTNLSEEIGDVDVTSDLKSHDLGFAMADSFFGNGKGEETNDEKVFGDFDPSPPSEKETSEIVKKKEVEVEQKPQKIESKHLFTEVKKEAEVPSKKRPKIEAASEVVVKEKKKSRQGPTLELLADKDYPSAVASKQYDLSRMLTTDTFIPAVMYTAINSEIPSKTVLAIVESDVVGFHGNSILIPKGSKIEGVYETLNNKHARRMQITWFKITRPDGIILKLDGESADVQGASGLTGYLDQRLKDRYGGALLLSSINALAQLSVKENDVRQLAAVESFGREFGTLTAQIIRENMNAMPIIMIRQGTRFNIRPYVNIYFPEPDNSALFTKKN